MDISSQLGIHILKTLGFEFPQGEVELSDLVANNISQQDKSADFFVHYKGNSQPLNVLVEVKLKEPDSQIYTKREKILKSGEIYESKPYANRDSKLETIIRNANNQLKESSQKYNSDFNILLFIAISYDSSIHTQQIINSLYGLVKLANLTTKSLKKCYFYNHNEFRRRESIDCVLIAQSNMLYEPSQFDKDNSFDPRNFSFVFCLNPFSAKISTLKHDFLISFKNQFYGKDIEIIDPMIEIDNDEAYCLTPEDLEKLKDSLSKLKDEDKDFIKKFPLYSPINKYLSEKYGQLLIDFNSETPTFTMRY